ncbi:hypothetical protein KY285_010727 [Solanum tuberosum]|nr:hypothetical protein KY289_011307 [Solanum tuberosum]KAH0735020.1 hypothetical protein KY285_010727 [Solanum tuberosum]
MSPEQSQYIWRKTIPHIEVGMGSGVFTSYRSARKKMEQLDFGLAPGYVSFGPFAHPPPVEAS